MPRSKASQSTLSNIFSVNRSLDSMKELYRTSYKDDFGKKREPSSPWKSVSAKYNIFPPIANAKPRNENEKLAESRTLSKSESSLPDLSLNQSKSESCKCTRFSIRNHFISNLVLDSRIFKKLLELHGKS